MEFHEIAKQRYATKLFDGKAVPEDKLNELLEIIRLSASSFGLQPYVVQVIGNADLKKKLRPSSYDQPQITTCSHLLVFCANKNVKERIDEYEQMSLKAGVPEDNVKEYIGMMHDFEQNLSEKDKAAWASKQTYIAVGNAINGAKSLGFDSCPMEGFDAGKYAEILELSTDLVPVALVTIGYAADKQKPKIRYPSEKLFVRRD